MKTFFKSLILGFGLILGTRGMSRSANIYISSQEAKENNLTGQQVADSLDDRWIGGWDPLVSNATYQYKTHLFTSSGNVGTSTLIRDYSQTNASPIQTTVSLRNVTGSDLRGQLHTTSFPSISDAIILQDTAPKPFSLQDALFRNEESAGSTSSQNGVLFEFSQPIGGFGVWIGDVESRTDGTGVAAEVKLFDIAGNLIQSAIIQPTINNQSLCGGSTSTSSPSECGNETTRFVGFTDSSHQVASMLIVVGDDDAGDDGFREHLSFVGPTVALQIKPGVCGVSGSWISGSLPTTESLCSQGIVTNLSNRSTGQSRSCLGINTNEITLCSISITANTVTSGTMLSGTSITGTTSTGTIVNSGVTTSSGTTLSGTNMSSGTTTSTGGTSISGTGSISGTTSSSGTTLTGGIISSGTTTGTIASGSTIVTSGSTTNSGIILFSIPTRSSQGATYQIIPLPTPQRIVSGSGTTIKHHLKKMLDWGKSGILETMVQTIIPQALPETGVIIKRILKKLHYYNTTTLSSLGYRVVK